MAKVMLQETVVSDTLGQLPAIGSLAQNFSLTAGDLSEKTLESYTGKKKLLNIVPSLDTGVCATSTKKFNEQAGSLDNTIVLVISADLPFAQQRFCETEGLNNVESLSTFRSSFSDDYELKIIAGPLTGLCSRAVIALDENNKVLYTEQVPEITQEPDYDGALAALK